MIRVTSSGSFKKTMQFIDRLRHGDIYKDLDRYGAMGVRALAGATPQDTGRTANAWYYQIQRSRSGVIISWHNNNVNQGAVIAILLQYGHGTGTGGYVQGRDYINPAARPIFDQIAADVWKKVTSG
ncbi:HK97 gp10 family phage protein [Patescibacteria group bacterium]|nr:HK97 gp10 family phage protein [Patescibacteria group bacterium]